MRRGARLRITASRIATGNKWLLLASLALLGACGSQEPSSSPAPAGDAVDAASVEPDATDQDTTPTICPSGHISGPDGECMAVGIQGCDAMFINPETGLCEPSVDHCPPGEIPIFSGEDQGCRAVGIVDCHPDFLDAETGRCEPDPDSCDDGSIPVPTQGCVSLDPPGGCGEGTWGDVEELGGDVYVDVGYTGGGSDGTRENPWTLIADGLAQVQSGGRVVLAAGVYEEGALLAKSTSLVGRCGSMVTLSGVRNGPTGPTVLEAKGNVDIAVRDLKISGQGLGLIAYSGVRVSLERVALDGNRDIGLVALQDKTVVQATDCLIARTRSLEDKTHGRGVQVSAGASLVLERVGLIENREFGLLAAEVGTTVEVTDCLIAHTQPREGDLAGWGLQVRDGASLELERSALWENHAIGLVASGAGTTVVAHQMLVARTQPKSNGTRGRGVEIESGTSLTVDRSALVENSEIGLAIFDPGTSAKVSESLIFQTQPWSDGNTGRGMQVKDGGALEVDHVSLVENHDIALAALGGGTSLTVNGSLITGTQRGFGGGYGHGIGVQDDPSFAITGSALVDNHDVSLVVIRSDTSVVVTEVYVSGTGTTTEGLRGVGIGLREVKGFSVERVVIEESSMAGLFFELSDGEVSHAMVANTSLDADEMGDGLLITQSVVTANGIVSHSNARAGVLFDETSGELNSSLVTQNVFGLVTQGSVTPVVADSTLVMDNEEDFLISSDLAVPDEPMELPDLSGLE